MDGVFPEPFPPKFLQFPPWNQNWSKSLLGCRVSKAQGFSDFLQTQRVFRQIWDCVFLVPFSLMCLFYFFNFIPRKCRSKSWPVAATLAVLVCAFVFSVQSLWQQVIWFQLSWLEKGVECNVTQWHIPSKCTSKDILTCKWSTFKEKNHEAGIYPGYKSMSVWN